MRPHRTQHLLLSLIAVMHEKDEELLQIKLHKTESKTNQARKGESSLETMGKAPMQDLKDWKSVKSRIVGTLNEKNLGYFGFSIMQLCTQYYFHRFIPNALISIFSIHSIQSMCNFLYYFQINHRKRMRQSCLSS